jgi:hypothetical protein
LVIKAFHRISFGTFSAVPMNRFFFNLRIMSRHFHMDAQAGGFAGRSSTIKINTLEVDRPIHRSRTDKCTELAKFCVPKAVLPQNSSGVMDMFDVAIAQHFYTACGCAN